ncbi:MAG TPA: hypothetical protein ENO21_00400, partial [Firmicutes bacterium]|nr:hypothetical protein [Bacillota bacterium]
TGNGHCQLRAAGRQQLVLEDLQEPRDLAVALGGAELTVPIAGEYATLREGDAAVPRMRHHYTFGEYGEISSRLIERFIAAMDDDVNCPQATAALFDYVNELYAAGIEGGTDAQSQLAAYRCLARHLYVLGIEFPNAALYPQLAADCFPAGGDDAESAALKAFVDRLLQARQQARADKDFAKADMLRDVLADAGLVVEDTADGPRWSLV